MSTEHSGKNLQNLIVELVIYVLFYPIWFERLKVSMSQSNIEAKY